MPVKYSFDTIIDSIPRLCIDLLIFLPLPLETSCSFLPFISKSSISKMRVAPFGIESLGGSSPYALSYNGMNTHTQMNAWLLNNTFIDFIS